MKVVQTAISDALEPGGRQCGAAVSAVDITTALRLHIHTSSRGVGPYLFAHQQQVGTSRTQRTRASHASAS